MRHMLTIWEKTASDAKQEIDVSPGVVDSIPIAMAAERLGDDARLGEKMINLARRGNPDALTIVNSFLRAHTTSGTAPPLMLRTYLADFLGGKILPQSKRTGPPIGQNDHRDFMIAIAVDGLIQVHGLNASRSGHRMHSACSLLSEVLKERGIRLSEDAVLKIWKRVSALRSQFKIRNNP